jgi:putative transposase
MDAWAHQAGVKLDFIRPGRPVQNGYIESFNGRLRECVGQEHLTQATVNALISEYENWLKTSGR